MCRFRADWSRRAAVCLLLGLTLGGCGTFTTRSSLADDARTFVRLAVALGERDPDSLDFYSGPFALVADVRANPPSLAEIKRQAEALSVSVAKQERANPAEAARVRLLAEDLAALRARVDLLTGTRLTYDDESQAFFGITPDRSTSGGSRTSDRRSRRWSAGAACWSIATRRSPRASRSLRTGSRPS